MMVTYLGKATKKIRFSLPYGMVFTLLFRESGLGIPEDNLVKELRYTDFYNEGTLHRMGHSKQETVWVRTHPFRQSTFTIHLDIPSSTALVTEISSFFETPILVSDNPQRSDSLPTQSNIQLTSDQLQQITTSIIVAFTL